MKFKQFLLSGIAVVALAGAAHAGEVTLPVTAIGDTSTSNESTNINAHIGAVVSEVNDNDTRIGVNEGKITALETTAGTILGAAAPTEAEVEAAKVAYDGSAAALTGATDGGAATAYDTFMAAVESMPETTPGEIADKQAWTDYLAAVKTASEAGEDTMDIAEPAGAGSLTPAQISDFQGAVESYEEDRAEYRNADADRKLVTGAQADGKSGKAVADFVQSDRSEGSLDRAVIESFNAVDEAVGANAENIATNIAGIATNKTATETNATDIATNKTAIETNATDIAANTADIAANKTAIETNATDIATNKTAIETNATDIAANKTAIETNATDIAANKTAIETNATDIAANTADIAANKTAIETNATDIATNKTAIETNATDIAANTADIATNKTEIARVDTNIGDIDDLTSTTYFTGIAAEDGTAVAPESITAALSEADKRLKDAFAAVGGNASDIAKNTTAIGKNTEAIAKNTTAIGENTARIVALEEDVESLKSGVAMAVAMANAPVIQGGANGFSLSGGFGYYDGASAASVKAAFMPTDNIAITASVASDFGDEFAVGGGVGFAF